MPARSIAVCHAFVMSTGNTCAVVRGRAASKAHTAVVNGTPRASPFLVRGKVAQRRVRSTCAHSRAAISPLRAPVVSANRTNGYRSGESDALHAASSAVRSSSESQRTTSVDAFGFVTLAQGLRVHDAHFLDREREQPRQLDQVIPHRRRRARLDGLVVVPAAVGAEQPVAVQRDQFGRDLVEPHVAELLAPVGEDRGGRIGEPGQGVVDQVPERHAAGGRDACGPCAAASVRAAHSSAASLVGKDLPVAG